MDPSVTHSQEQDSKEEDGTMDASQSIEDDGHAFEWPVLFQADDTAIDDIERFCRTQETGLGMGQDNQVIEDFLKTERQEKSSKYPSKAHYSNVRSRVWLSRRGRYYRKWKEFNRPRPFVPVLYQDWLVKYKTPRKETVKLRKYSYTSLSQVKDLMQFNWDSFTNSNYNFREGINGMGNYNTNGDFCNPVNELISTVDDNVFDISKLIYDLEVYDYFEDVLFEIQL